MFFVLADVSYVTKPSPLFPHNMVSESGEEEGREREEKSERRNEKKE